MDVEYLNIARLIFVFLKNFRKTCLMINKKIIFEWGNFRRTLLFFAFYVVLGIYPAMVALVNPVPDRSELVWITAKIVNTKDKQPNLVIELPNKNIRKFNFPVSLYFSTLNGSTRFVGLRGDQLKRLSGCTAQLGTKPIAWGITDQPYVWEIRSACGDFTYEQAADFFKKFGGFDLIAAIMHMVFVSFLVFIFCFERNRAWARLKD